MLPVQHNIDVSRSRNSGMVMLDVDGGGAAGYAPLTTMAPQVLAMIAARAPAGGVGYRVKVVENWLVKHGHGADAEFSVKHISLPPISVIPGPPANTANAEIVHLGDLFARLRTESEERVEDNENQGSACVYERIRQVRFIIITSAMARRVHGGALGVAGAKVKLPSELSNKHCCVNIDNSDNLCFRYAAICLGNKTYELDN